MPKLLTLVFLLSIFFLSECKKYSNGPSISLRSKTERVANTWTLEKYLTNNVDSTSAFKNLFKDYTLTLTKSGSYTISYFVTIPVFGNVSNTESGRWDFINNKKDILITPTSIAIGSLPSASTYNILKLKEKELWIKNDNINGKVIELHYKPK